jgi:hypothetical protein
MGKNQDPGSGINIPDPQHWYPAFQTVSIGDSRIRTVIICTDPHLDPSINKQ